MARKPTTTDCEHAPADKAVILLSGGLDSYTTAAIAQAQGFTCYALTVAYGQRHHQEIACAQQIAQSLHLPQHKIIEIDLAAIGGSALLGTENPVPKSDTALGPSDTAGDVPTAAIPPTYVPARNTILLAIALGYAEVLGAFDIFIGANAVDYSGYPDCRAEFITAFEKMANLATKAALDQPGRLRIHAPLVNMSKGQIITRGAELNLDYSLTNSCYDPDSTGRPCGKCDSCRLRLKGFAQANLTDPLEYAPKE